MHFKYERIYKNVSSASLGAATRVNYPHDIKCAHARRGVTSKNNNIFWYFSVFVCSLDRPKG